MINKFIIDIRMVNSSGIGTYIQNLVPKIILAYPNLKFFLLGKKSELGVFKWSNFQNVEVVDTQSNIYSVKEQQELYKAIFDKNSLFWSPHFNIPILSKGEKRIVTVHDVYHLAMPSKNDIKGFLQRTYAKFMFNRIRKLSDSIICVSNFTKNELIRMTGENEKDNINVIHNGVDYSWFNIEKSISPYKKPYILFVGNVKPHKNLIRLIKAYKTVYNIIEEDLIIVGKREGFINGDPEVSIIAESLGNRVHFTGYVKDEVLKQYFKHASAFIFPSLYEGFGLPPLEAMACGCPVIVSSAASLPEVCGDAALYVDPYNIEDIAEKIKLLLSDDKLREELKRKGLERAKLFSWERCAKETIKVIEEVLAK